MMTNTTYREKSLGILSVCLLMACFLFSCKKDTPDAPVERNEKWRTQAKTDSVGNQYYVVNTLDNTLEIRVDNKDGKTIFSEVCPTIEASEIPENSSKIFTYLVAPNKYINANQATLSLRIVLDNIDIQEKHLQLLANIDLDSKKFYTKKYKVEEPLVREGTDKDLNRGGGFMGLGQRGTQLVCYERDFSIRYTKDIDASDAYYPSGNLWNIPINNYEYMLFLNDGYVGRMQIVTSVEDKWAGKQAVIWRDNLKETNNIPADYSIRITDYNIQNNVVSASYNIYDEKGQLKEKRTRKWAISNGMPLGS